MSRIKTLIAAAMIIGCCLLIAVPGCGKVPTWNELTSDEKKAEPKDTSAADYANKALADATRSNGSTQPAPEVKPQPRRTPDVVIAGFMNTPPSQRTDAQLAELAKLPNGLEEIVEMDLSGSAYVTEVGLSELPKFTAIKVLKLDGLQASGEAYAGISGLPQLEVFTASRSRFNELSMRHLAPLTNLRVLDLSHTFITDPSFIHLQKLKKLEEINVSKCAALNGRGFEALRGAPLRVVSAGATQFGQFGPLHIKGSRTLEELAATRCGMSDEALLVLKSCSSLKKLYLSHNNLSDLGAKHLGAHRGLVELHLRNTRGISDVGLKFFTKMKQLETLDLEGTAVSPRGVEALRRLLKVCTILYQSRQWKGDKAG